MIPHGIRPGRLDYPSQKETKQSLNSLACKIWLFNATDVAMDIGDPIFANIIMSGALSATKELPLGRDNFKTSMETQFGADKIKQNLEAFDQGINMVKSMVKP